MVGGASLNFSWIFLRFCFCEFQRSVADDERGTSVLNLTFYSMCFWWHVISFKSEHMGDFLSIHLWKFCLYEAFDPFGRRYKESFGSIFIFKY